jgi:hypothetical protein
MYYDDIQYTRVVDNPTQRYIQMYINRILFEYAFLV